jgi:predicted RNA-binding Zn ribbon-like protein
MSLYDRAMVRPETSSAVPQATPALLADAVVELLNTRPHAAPRSPETLADAESAERVLRPFRSADPSSPPALSAADIAQLRRLRDLLAQAVGRPGGEGGQHVWEELNRLAAPQVFRHVFSADGHTALAQVSGSSAVGSVVRAVAELIAADRFSRIRLCANEECSHAFYDGTRSRTQRWHSYEVCGNRANVAAYRARQTA